MPEAEYPTSSPAYQSNPETVWSERTYDAWKPSSKKVRRRAKQARQTALRAWRQKKARQEP